MNEQDLKRERFTGLIGWDWRARSGEREIHGWARSREAAYARAVATFDSGQYVHTTSSEHLRQESKPAAVPKHRNFRAARKSESRESHPAISYGISGSRG